MKIVITGITSFRNHGVEALVVTTLNELRERLPDSRFLVLDRMPEYDASRLDLPDVAFKFDSSIRPLKANLLRRSMLRLSNQVKALGRDYQDVLAEIRSASLVLASGGDVFCSEYGHTSLLTHLEPLRIARDAGIPFLLHAQSVGPFRNETDAAAFSEIVRGASHITVRERMSFDYLTRQLGFDGGRVTLTADPAFLLGRTEASWREHFGMENGKPVVALATSQAICNWMNSSYEKHFDSWCAVIAHLRKTLDANIILIPHVQEVSTRNDDRILATDLIRHFNYEPRIQVAGGDFSASDFKGIISQCDLVVAERMHAAIAGLSSGVCTVVVGYSVKAEGILRDLLESETVENDVLISINDFLVPGKAIATIDNAWRHRQKIAQQLQKTLPDMRSRSAENFNIIADRAKSNA